jgi:hypothetical protein
MPILVGCIESGAVSEELASRVYLGVEVRLT